MVCVKIIGVCNWKTSHDNNNDNNISNQRYIRFKDRQLKDYASYTAKEYTNYTANGIRSDSVNIISRRLH